jgi:hypothetical protein
LRNYILKIYKIDKLTYPAKTKAYSYDTVVTKVNRTLPLFLSTDAGANNRHILGDSVVFGMIVATFIAILFILVLFYVKI